MERKQNRLKLVEQLKQVLEWLEQILIGYNKTKVNKIFCNRIKIN